MHVGARLVVAAVAVTTGLMTAPPAFAAAGQAHGTFSYYQVSPTVIAQGAVTNPNTATCYPIPEGPALLLFNDTDTDGEAFQSADCSGTSEALPHRGGGVGSYASVKFGDSSTS